MKFRAVEFMRKARDQISKDIQGMSFEEEKKYLKQHSKSFAYLTEKSPNKSFQRTANAAAEFRH
ncbi:hypothetical protein [Candidatus Spongiihabitans sp.]|uniref:hypothetical protein n=1 Tax=Candidatus Spongiihabitans sp. TaxID=3101308 RepID=UPI003C6F628D